MLYNLFYWKVFLGDMPYSETQHTPNVYLKNRIAGISLELAFSLNLLVSVSGIMSLHFFTYNLRACHFPYSGTLCGMLLIIIPALSGPLS